MVSIFIFDDVTVKTENNEVSLYRAFVFMYFTISGVTKIVPIPRTWLKTGSLCRGSTVLCTNVSTLTQDNFVTAQH